MNALRFLKEIRTLPNHKLLQDKNQWMELISATTKINTPEFY
jgi:hypothetical protein